MGDYAEYGFDQQRLIWYVCRPWDIVFEGQFLFKKRGISSSWRPGLRNDVREEDILTNCMLKHNLTLKTLIPNSIALSCIIRNCVILHLEDFLICRHRKTGVYAGHCFTPKLFTSREMGIVHSPK